MNTKSAVNVIGAIPARWESTRFPGKPLAIIAGKPMIIRVWEQACKAKLLDKVIIATDNDTIAETVINAGGEAIMVYDDVASGTDRIAKAVEQISCQIVLNIQGDEPLLDPNLLDAMVMTMQEGAEIDIITACHEINAEEALNDNRVKVIYDSNGYAKFFSRAPIPVGGPYLCHVGIYGYRIEVLRRFVSLPQAELEKIYRLEQLRALQAGMKIKVLRTNYQSIAVDVPQDIITIENYLKNTTTI